MSSSEEIGTTPYERWTHHAEAETQRTADDERRDVLLTLDRLAAEKENWARQHLHDTLARAVFDAAASALRMAYEIIERGDHEGAWDR